jgi:hypothetical protein
MMTTRASMDFDSFMDCDSIAASTEEILWSDDETIIAEQENIWHKGESKCGYGTVDNQVIVSSNLSPRSRQLRWDSVQHKAVAAKAVLFSHASTVYQFDTSRNC